jgi:hypothetical protein
MDQITLPRLRAEAKKQLLNYRRNHSRLYRSEALRAEGGAVRGWVRAIDTARGYFCDLCPTKERFMCRLFGLETPIPRNQTTRERMIKLSLELNVAESTLYKWREDIFEIVLYAAIEAGLIRPFGIGKNEGNMQETKEKCGNGEETVSNPAND